VKMPIVGPGSEGKQGTEARVVARRLVLLTATDRYAGNRRRRRVIALHPVDPRRGILRLRTSSFSRQASCVSSVRDGDRANWRSRRGVASGRSSTTPAGLMPRAYIKRQALTRNVDNTEIADPGAPRASRSLRRRRRQSPKLAAAGRGDASRRCQCGGSGGRIVAARATARSRTGRYPGR